MIPHIYIKTLTKYKTTNDEYNKIMINHIINKNKNSLLFSYYQIIKNKINSQSYIYKLYNLYQSIKLLIKITESENKNIIYQPKLLNKYFQKLYFQNLENQNKITKTKNNEKNISNDMKMDNSISSIKKTIDLDEKDIIQNGCLDFATGNEMQVLLKYFQKKPKEYLYNNYNKICNIYKKKKSSQVSFHTFSPKNKYIIREINYCDNANKNNMINNNIYINNNNFNNHTNFIINDYKGIKDIDHLNKNNFIEKKQIKNDLFNNFNFQTQSNIFSNRLTYRNRFSLPLSQSCEKFIYTKKYIHSKIKKKKIGNKTVEELEKENEEEENVDNLENIEEKYIPYINKNSNIKIIENNGIKKENKKLNVDKLNYIGRNKYNKINKNKFPFILSRITKNNKNNRKENLTQTQYSTSKINSTFNMNYLSTIKPNEIKIEKTKIEKNKNIKLNVNSKNNFKNKSNPSFIVNNKKETKNIKKKEKENNLKLKKNNTSNNTNFKRNLRQNFYNIEKTTIKEKRIEIEKYINNKHKEKLQNKSKNILNTNRFISPEFNREYINKTPINNIQFTCKNKNKKIIFSNLLNHKKPNDYSNINKSNKNLKLNLGMNKTNNSKIMKKVLSNSKSNGNLNNITKQLFSPITRKSFYINKVGFITNENLINNKIVEENTDDNNNENNDNCFNTLPNNSKRKNSKIIKRKTVSPLKNKKDNLFIYKISNPIKVNLSKKGFNDFSHNKNNCKKQIKKYNSSESFDFDSNKFLFLTTNRLLKEKKNIKKNSMKLNQSNKKINMK